MPSRAVIAATVIASLLGAGAVAAQSIGEPLPGRKPAAAKPSPARTEAGARPCPEYGPGFVRAPGSTVCVRVGGQVRVDYGKQSRAGFGSSAGAALQLEARSESSLGPVRAVVRGHGQVDRGPVSAYR